MFLIRKQSTLISDFPLFHSAVSSRLLLRIQIRGFCVLGMQFPGCFQGCNLPEACPSLAPAGGLGVLVSDMAATVPRRWGQPAGERPMQWEGSLQTESFCSQHPATPSFLESSSLLLGPLATLGNLS